MIKSVVSAFQILDCFVSGGPRLGFNDLERMTGMSKSTLHSLIESLLETRALSRDPATGLYHLGYRLVSYADTARRLSIVEIAQPIMDRLRDDIGESVSLATIEANKQVIIATAESKRILRVAPRIGARNLMHYTAVGKSMLAHLPVTEVRRIVAEAGLPATTPNTITSLDDLERELEHIRKLGYSTDNMEHNEDVRCVGSAILDRDRVSVAGISVSAPAFRVDEDDFKLMGEKVRTAADLISREIGGAAHLEESPTSASK